jgi:hypothetical protein
MSHKLIRLALERSEAGGHALLVLLILADKVNPLKNGNLTCWPGLDKISKRANLGKSTVCRCLDELEELREIARKRSSGGYNTRTCYDLSPLVKKATKLSHGETVELSHGETVSQKELSQIGTKTVPNWDTQLISKEPVIKNTAQAEPSLPLSRVITFPKKSKPARQPDSAQAAAFARFYEFYPRHVGKKPARTAWLKINPGPALTQTIMQAVERYREQVKDTEEHFILHPATWLNQERWEDEPAESQPVKEPKFIND